MLATRGAPAFAMFADPIEKGALEADVVAESFGLEPFVLQDLFPFGEEFLVEAGLLDELAGRRCFGLFGGRVHSISAGAQNQSDAADAVNADPIARCYVLHGAGFKARALRGAQEGFRRFP